MTLFTLQKVDSATTVLQIIASTHGPSIGLYQALRMRLPVPEMEIVFVEESSS